MANVINNIMFGETSYLLATTAYATCDSESTSSTKTAYIGGETGVNSGFFLTTGVTIHIKFTYSNTVADPKLSVNGTTAIPIKSYGTIAPGIIPETSWYAGETVTFTYDGTYWQMNKNRLDLENVAAKLTEIERRMEALGIPPNIEIE